MLFVDVSGTTWVAVVLGAFLLLGPRWELELTEKGTGSVPFSDTSSDRCQRTLSVLLGAAR